MKTAENTDIWEALGQDIPEASHLAICILYSELLYPNLSNCMLYLEYILKNDDSVSIIA